jgi:hypothetical protein
MGVDSHNLIVDGLLPLLSMVMSDPSGSFVCQHDNSLIVVSFISLLVVFALSITFEVVLLHESAALEPGDLTGNLVALWWWEVCSIALALNLLVSL